VSMAARAAFSHRRLHGQGQADMLEMLTGAGVDFEAYPTFFKRGTFVRRVTFDRAFTPEELQRIPENYRPAADARVTRSEVREIDMPPFSQVGNREGVVFDAEAPTRIMRTLAGTSDEPRRA